MKLYFNFLFIMFKNAEKNFYKYIMHAHTPPRDVHMHGHARARRSYAWSAPPRDVHMHGHAHARRSKQTYLTFN